jgi:hypothetical protein
MRINRRRCVNFCIEFAYLCYFNCCALDKEAQLELTGGTYVLASTSMNRNSFLFFDRYEP